MRQKEISEVKEVNGSLTLKEKPKSPNSADPSVSVRKNASPLKKNFYLIMAAIFWILMMVGFSDNWLFDVTQESNFSLKFQIHALFAFSWFSLLVVQSALVRKHNVKLHMKIGIIGIIIYYLMTLTIWNLYFEPYLQKDELLHLFKPLELLSIILVTMGFIYRKNRHVHRAYIIFGSFCLIGPALDRTVFHLFGPAHMILPMFMLYLILFGFFVWYQKKFKWYMGVWLIALIYSLYPMLVQ